MSLKKRGDNWWIDITYKGRRIRQSTGTVNQKLAGQIEAKRRTELVEGKYFDKGQGDKRTFKDMADKYMTEYAIEKAPKSMSRDETSLNHLIPAFGNKYLSQITPAMIARYKVVRRAQGASASSINKELAFSKHAYNITLKDWEWVTDNPFIKIPMEKVNNGRLRYLTYEEYENLINACDSWLKPIVITAVNTGMRKGNVMGLTWQQIDLARGMILLEHTKNGERQGIPMNENVKEVFQELSQVRYIHGSFVFTYPDGSQVKETAIQRHFKRACKKAGIEDFRFHDLRHTFASWLVQSGVDLYSVQRLLGHKEFKMTQRYAHLAPENLKNAISVLNDTFRTQSGSRDASKDA
jgi:integrase